MPLHLQRILYGSPVPFQKPYILTRAFKARSGLTHLLTPITHCSHRCTSSPADRQSPPVPLSHNSFSLEDSASSHSFRLSS